jgi:hypothetical protein
MRSQLPGDPLLHPGTTEADIDPEPVCDYCGKPLTLEEQEMCAGKIGQVCGWHYTTEDDPEEDR